MKQKKSKTKLLTDVEAALASEQPFGDYRYIDERNWLQYEARLEVLKEHVAEAGATLTALRRAKAPSRYRVIGDPVVRSVINTALAHYKLDGPEIVLDDTKEILRIAARYLAENRPRAPLMVGAPRAQRLGRRAYHAWVWCDEREEDIPAQSFRRLFFRQEGGRSALWTPDEHGQKMLMQGTRLLGELLPKVARSALNHLHLMVVLNVPNRNHWRDDRYCLPFDSFSTAIILGTVFLSKTALKDPWRVAEYLLHESLHQKQHDIEHTHSVLRDGYDPEYCPKIRSPWNRSLPESTNEWPACRTLGAFHVYVHLALLFKVIEQRADELESRYGSLNNLNPKLAARRALDRARYLGIQLREISDELGLAGHRFLDWLFDALAKLEPAPPPPDPNVHMLDLYDSEAERIRYLIANWNHVSNRYLHRGLIRGKKARPKRELMLQLVADEIALAREVASLKDGCRPELELLLRCDSISPSTLAQKTDIELASIFQEVRTYVYQSLRLVSSTVLPKACPGQPRKTVAQLMSEIVETSGDCLDTYAHLPD